MTEQVDVSRWRGDAGLFPFVIHGKKTYREEQLA